MRDDLNEETAAKRRELAAALRGLVSAVVEHDLPAEVTDELITGVDDLRARVAGPRRRRYYDPKLEGSPSSSFVDFSPISGLAHPWAIPMSTEPSVGADGTPGVRARLKVSATQEGPPKGVHGGVIAAVFDELLGHAQHVHGIQALTATLTVRFRAVTPIDADLEFFAQVVHAKGRRFEGRAWCWAGDTLTAEAEALFVGVELGALSGPL